MGHRTLIKGCRWLGEAVPWSYVLCGGFLVHVLRFADRARDLSIRPFYDIVVGQISKYDGVTGLWYSSTITL